MEQMIKQIKQVKDKLICIIGIDPETIIPIIQTAGYNNKILFFDRDINKQAKLFSFADPILHENIKFIFDENPNLYKIMQSKEDILRACSQVIIIEFGEIIQHNESWYQNIIETIKCFDIKIKDTYKTSQISKYFFKNRFENLLTLSKATSLKKLENAYDNKPAIIVAAGPSLSKNIDNLSKTKDKCIIIAVDSAVVPLLNNNIVPDYIVTVDFRQITYKKLEPVQHLLSQTNLIMLCESTPEIANKIKFKNIYFATQNKTTCKMMEDILYQKICVIKDISCVTHLGLFSAQIFGCNPIVFAGMDFAYSGEKDHAEGCVLNGGNNVSINSESVFIEGCDGRKVHTSPSLISIKEICEILIDEYPEIQYINATEHGARIKNTSEQKLKNVIDQFDSIVEISCNHEVFVLPHVIINRLRFLKYEALGAMNLLKRYRNFSPDAISHKDLKKLDRSWLKKIFKKMDDITTQLNDKRVIKFTKELLSEYHNEYLSYNERSNLGSSLHANLEKQIFVNAIREKALVTFVECIDTQIEIFKNLEQQL